MVEGVSQFPWTPFPKKGSDLSPNTLLSEIGKSGGLKWTSVALFLACFSLASAQVFIAPLFEGTDRSLGDAVFVRLLAGVLDAHCTLN